MSRTCKKCNKEKELDDFPNARIGYKRKICKPCYAEDNLGANRKRVRRVSIERAAGINKAYYIWKDCLDTDRRRKQCNDLTQEYVAKIIQYGCSYCCDKTQQMLGLDRIDNSIGHIKSNVVVACSRCNFIKNDMPHEAWMHIAPKIREAFELGLFKQWKGFKYKY